jgi:hypothetical protein
MSLQAIIAFIIFFILNAALVVYIFLVEFKRRRFFYIPEVVLSVAGVVFLVLAILPQAPGSWNDLVFTIFAIYALIANVGLFLMTWLVYHFLKKAKKI